MSYWILQFPENREAFGSRYSRLFTGGVGACRHADYSVDPPQRHHPESPNFTVIQRPPLLVPAHQERARGGPGVVHVPG